MFAQRKAPFTPRSNPGSRYGYHPAPIRARVGLAMRRAMNFGEMPEAETTLRSSGLSLAPMSIGEADVNVGGTSVLATAGVADLDNGALKALVVPGGSSDAASCAALDDAITRAWTKGAPVFAFGDGVVVTLDALGMDSAPYADAPAVIVTGDMVETLADLNAVAVAAGRVG